LTDNEAPAPVAPLSLVAGGLTTYFATRGFMRHRQFVSAERSRRLAQVSVAPIIPLDGSNGAGVAFQLRF
jgi:hypothetical protein